MNAVTVGDISKQIRGVTYKKSDVSGEPLPDFVPVLRAGNIVDGEIDLSDLVYVPKHKVSPDQYLRQGDILIAASSGSLNIVGKAARVRQDYETGFGAFCKVLRPNKEVIPAYFANFFQTQRYRHTVSNLAAGANINNLRNEHLDNLEIPLPPLPEQQRIAAILDKADALRAKRRVALAKLDTLLQATFLDMFGDPVTNPMGWEVMELGDLLSTIIDYRGKTPPKSPSGIPLISAANVKNGRVDISKPQFISNETYAKWTTRGFTRPGDVLITTEAPVGSVAAYPEKDTYQISRRVMALRPNSDLIQPQYLLEVMLHPNWHIRLTAVTRGSTVPRVLKPDITTQLIPVPPLEVQKEFVKQKHWINTIREKHENYLVQTDCLFHALQQRAFKGEL